MAQAQDLIREIHGLMTHTAKQIDETPTGVTPGYSSVLGGTVLPNGKMRYVKAGASGLIASCFRATTDQSISTATNTIVDFNTAYYDPGSTVTTGASWICVPGVIGWYQVIVSIPILANGTDWTAGDQVFFDLYSGPSGSEFFYREPFVWTKDRGTNQDSGLCAFTTLIEITDVTYGIQLHCTHTTGVTRKLGHGQSYANIDIIRVQ